MKVEIVVEGWLQASESVADVVQIHYIDSQMESIAGRAATDSAVNISVQQEMTSHSEPNEVTELGHASLIV